MGCAPQRDVSSDRGLGRCFGNLSRKPQARSVQIARDNPLAWLVMGHGPLAGYLKLHGDWQADSPCVVLLYRPIRERGPPFDEALITRWILVRLFLFV